MATNSRLRPPTGGNIKQGICRNTEYLDPDKGTTGPCPKCASGEIQKVNVQRLSDFKCSVCGSKLEPVKAGLPKWLIPGCIALVLIIGVGIFWAINSDTPAPETTVEEVETTDGVPDKTIPTLQTDSTEVGESQAETPITDTIVATEPAKDKPEKATQAPATPKIRVPFGTYSGPTDGNGGEIKVISRYSLSLRNAAHETIELMPGDVITRTMFKNGELVGGYWQRGAEKRYFHR